MKLGSVGRGSGIYARMAKTKKTNKSKVKTSLMAGIDAGNVSSTSCRAWGGDESRSGCMPVTAEEGAVERREH